MDKFLGIIPEDLPVGENNQQKLRLFILKVKICVVKTSIKISLKKASSLLKL